MPQRIESLLNLPYEDIVLFTASNEKFNNFIKIAKQRLSDYKCTCCEAFKYDQGGYNKECKYEFCGVCGKSLKDISPKPKRGSFRWKDSFKIPQEFYYSDEYLWATQTLFVLRSLHTAAIFMKGLQIIFSPAIIERRALRDNFIKSEHKKLKYPRIFQIYKPTNSDQYLEWDSTSLDNLIALIDFSQQVKDDLIPVLLKAKWIQDLNKELTNPDEKKREFAKKVYNLKKG